MGVFWRIVCQWLGCSFATEYAPELKDNLIGAALGGFAANLTGIAESVDGEVFSGFIPLALNGIANEYPDFKRDYTKKLNLVPKLIYKRCRELFGCITYQLSNVSIFHRSKKSI